MKFLIIGEYSGVSKNLKSGLIKLGHEVIIFSNGDGWKKISGYGDDYIFNYKKNFKILGQTIRGSWKFRALNQFFTFKRILKKYLNSFDSVILLNYEFIRFPWRELSP
jgi:hypothetical protein